jgi:hypothetical protein
MHEKKLRPLETSKFVANTWAAIPALENSPVREYVDLRGYLEPADFSDCHGTSDCLALSLHYLGVEGRRCYGYLPPDDGEDELTFHHSWVEVRRDDLLPLMSAPARENYERLEQNCIRYAKNKTRGLEWVALDAKRLNPDGSELLHLPLRWFQRSIFLKRTVARLPFALFVPSVGAYCGAVFAGGDA